MANTLEVKANAFMTAALAYVRRMDEIAAADASPGKVGEMYRLLARLQSSAADLPAVKPRNEREVVQSLKETTASNNRKEAEKARATATVVTSKLTVNEYCTVFDALDADDRVAIMKNLDDDLGDIYLELSRALALTKAEPLLDAVWEWRFCYYNQWGRHLVHAQAAIYSYLARNGRFLTE